VGEREGELGADVSSIVLPRGYMVIGDTTESQIDM
jgi:hypothetical protein